MYDKLFNYIEQYAGLPLTETDRQIIQEVFVPMKLRKKQYFLQEGEVCKYMAFIVKGATRQYTVDDKGAEHMVQLAIENWWISDRESFTMLTPTIYNIDAWEDCELLTTTKADATRLAHIPAAVQALREMDINHAIAMQKRVSSAIAMTAEQRYAQLVESNPTFLQRFPQHMIASYLGMTKETLSRIRMKASGK
ncbi:Crp/Fnr family transcriptional regulator [Pontibacter sp. 13R65]|uniref:Crp/Fnr family transcriptional regulator n=1 Tax=Pontibacter sp. 13R65 TaxID=3127458 RepID=UPI00301DE945